MSIMAESNNVIYERTIQRQESSKQASLVGRDTLTEFIVLPGGQSTVNTTAVQDILQEFGEEKEFVAAMPATVAEKDPLLLFEEAAYDSPSTPGFGQSMMENHSELAPAEVDADDSDEQTIATFLTAAGQRLALYAVEDSDEVFAVAVYDESGEPPTNFQFLMKSDVERLIGEGAVRTMKKPSQMNKQVYPTECDAGPDEEEEEERPEEIFGDVDDTSSCNVSSMPEDKKPCVRIKVEPESAPAKVESGKIMSSPPPDPVEQKEFTYFMMDNTSALPTFSPIAEIGYDECNSNDGTPTNTEIVEQSTVDDLFMEPDVSEDELTYADIEESLRLCGSRKVGNVENGDSNQSLSRLPTPACELFCDSEETMPTCRNHRESETDEGEIVIDRESLPKTPACSPSPEKTSLLTLGPTSTEATPLKKITVRKFGASSSLLTRREISSGEGRRKKPTNPNLAEDPSLMPEPIQNIAQIQIQRVKRSRKQQLTSVNRDDSEIIIQPASFSSSEGEDDAVIQRKSRRLSSLERRGKRSGRKKREAAYYKRKAAIAKRLAKKRNRQRKKRRAAVEVINIDVDEDDLSSDSSPQTKNNKKIVEITLDEVKEKGSSDKENEVIMVGDSDEEEEEEEEEKEEETAGKESEEENATGPEETAGTSKIVQRVFSCEHCSSNFRTKRTLNAHLHICPRLRDKNTDSTRLSRESSPKNTKSQRIELPANKKLANKEFKCKLCKEKFVLALALARHVRSMHMKKPKRPMTRAARAARITKLKEHERSSDESALNGRKKRRKRKASPTSAGSTDATWEPTKKLSCKHCTKWFSSAASLASHCLQHATKKSERQMRRCETCKKMIKSRLLYIRHMRMHSRAKKLQKNLHRSRQESVKLTVMRKRGRPRKL